MQPINTVTLKNGSGLTSNQILKVNELERKRVLIEETGGVLPISEVLSLTGWSQEQLMYKWFHGLTLGLELIGNVAFPKFQFKGNAMIDGLQDVNILLNKDSQNFWSCCHFLLNRHGYFGNEHLSPLDAIKSGRIDEVLMLIET